MNQEIAKLQNMITQSEYTIVVTGAGISVASDIRDMKHMNLFEVMQITSEKVLKATPDHYYRLMQKNFLNSMFQIGPTITHKKLAHLEEEGKIHGIITTNIDQLHSIAGSRQVAEIQGSFGVNKCLKCGEEYNDVFIWNHGKIPRCTKCGHVIGSFPIYSHIGLYEKDVAKAREWMRKAELVIVIGAQGSYAGAYWNYMNSKAKIAQINPKNTQFDQYSNLNIHERSDVIFENIE